MNLTDLQSVKVKKKSCVFFITAFAICISQRILHNRPIAIGYCLIYLLNRVYVESALIQSPVTGASLTVGLLVSQYVSVNMFQSICFSQYGRWRICNHSLIHQSPLLVTLSMKCGLHFRWQRDRCQRSLSVPFIHYVLVWLNIELCLVVSTSSNGTCCSQAF